MRYQPTWKIMRPIKINGNWRLVLIKNCSQTPWGEAKFSSVTFGRGAYLAVRETAKQLELHHGFWKRGQEMSVADLEAIATACN